MKTVLMILFLFSMLSIPLLSHLGDLMVEATGEEFMRYLVFAIALGPAWGFMLSKLFEENNNV